MRAPPPLIAARVAPCVRLSCAARALTRCIVRYLRLLFPFHAAIFCESLAALPSPCAHATSPLPLCHQHWRRVSLTFRPFSTRALVATRHSDSPTGPFFLKRRCIRRAPQLSELRLRSSCTRGAARPAFAGDNRSSPPTQRGAQDVLNGLLVYAQYCSRTTMRGDASLFLVATGTAVATQRQCSTSACCSGSTGNVSASAFKERGWAAGKGTGSVDLHAAVPVHAAEAHRTRVAHLPSPVPKTNSHAP